MAVSKRTVARSTQFCILLRVTVQTIIVPSLLAESCLDAPKSAPLKHEPVNALQFRERK